jgi:hypothetical protein
MTEIENIFAQVLGKNAWGLRRSVGSMFFLEFGESRRNSGEKHPHGEWHFLFQMCHWRLQSQRALIVGSDDDQTLIDERFAATDLGTVTDIKLQKVTGDLHVAFSSNRILKTFSTTASSEANETEWIFFTPSDQSWKKKTFGPVAIAGQTNRSR